MTRFTLWGNYAPKTPSTQSLQLQHNSRYRQKHCFRQDERLIIDLKQKPWWLLYTCASGEGRSSCVTSVTPSNHLHAVADRCRELGFLDSQRGHWTGYHALWSHVLSPAGPERRLPFVSYPLLTSTSYCHVHLLGQLSWWIEHPHH